MSITTPATVRACPTVSAAQGIDGTVLLETAAGEPVAVLRASDRHFVATMQTYLHLLAADPDADAALVTEMRALIASAQAWIIAGHPIASATATV